MRPKAASILPVGEQYDHLTSSLARSHQTRNHACLDSEIADIPANARPDHRQACIALIGDDSQLLYADGHDDTILGIAERDGISLVIYDA